MENIIRLCLVFNFAFISSHPFNQKLINHGDFKSGELYFQQKLDHLDSTNGDMWSQRYWLNHSYNKSLGAAFLFIHDAFTVSEIDSIDQVFLNPLAENLNATRFYLEHRFYGKSKPKSDTSLHSLIYLSSEQALADIAYFIEKITQQYEFLAGAKWVVLGISYGGSLATWARFKYPQLITSAIAINAPLLAKVDFAEYYENVVNSLNLHDRKCIERVTLANRALKETLSREEDRKKITKMFNLCNDVTEDPDDMSLLFDHLASNFAYAVDVTGMSVMSMSRKDISISKLCDIMLKREEKHALESYAEVNEEVSKNRDPGLKCYDHRYKNKVEKLKKIDYGDTVKISRQWIYQTCTEFGFFRSSGKTSGIFGDFPATFFVKRCQELFGPEFNITFIEDKVSSTNKKYGGLKIDVNQTIFIYYSEDPWRTLFITENKTHSYDVIKIDGTPHSHKKPTLANQYGISWFHICLKDLQTKVGCILSGGEDCL